jgi:hypothetical protein
MATLKIYVNCDTQDLPVGTTGVDWVEVNLGADALIFSNGSEIVKDGEPIPGSSALNQAGIVLTVLEQVIPHYFLADFNENLLKEIHNAGNQNKRYVFCFAFDGATASEPVLEMWDNTALNTFINYSLGAGTASNSWFRGVVTTNALPGTNWVGSKLAGSSDTHFLWLNNQAGALNTAKNLYCNLKVVVPASFPNAAAETPIMVVKYTGN